MAKIEKHRWDEVAKRHVSKYSFEAFAGKKVRAFLDLPGEHVLSQKDAYDFNVISPNHTRSYLIEWDRSYHKKIRSVMTKARFVKDFELHDGCMTKFIPPEPIDLFNADPMGVLTWKWFMYLSEFPYAKGGGLITNFHHPSCRQTGSLMKQAEALLKKKKHAKLFKESERILKKSDFRTVSPFKNRFLIERSVAVDFHTTVMFTLLRAALVDYKYELYGVRHYWGQYRATSRVVFVFKGIQKTRNRDTKIRRFRTVLDR